MTDKVQKIRGEVERLRNLHQMKYQQLDADSSMSIVECGKRNLCNELLSFIDSLQEEPVSIWHDSNEEQPNFASTVAIWNPKYKNGEIISRCTEVYSDRIWAYIDDLLKM